VPAALLKALWEAMAVDRPQRPRCQTIAVRHLYFQRTIALVYGLYGFAVGAMRSSSSSTDNSKASASLPVLLRIMSF
jgi:hypothetical protein